MSTAWSEPLLSWSPSGRSRVIACSSASNRAREIDDRGAAIADLVDVLLGRADNLFAPLMPDGSALPGPLGVSDHASFP